MKESKVEVEVVDKLICLQLESFAETTLSLVSLTFILSRLEYSIKDSYRKAWGTSQTGYTAEGWLAGRQCEVVVSHITVDNARRRVII